MTAGAAGRYMVGQVIGAIVGSAILFALTSTGTYGPSTATVSNGFSEGQMLQAFIAEIVFTFVFVFVVLGSTAGNNANTGKFAGLAIGLTRVLVHMVCIPVTGTSVNPARSIGPALFQGCEAICQLWLFIVAPFIGASIDAGVWKVFNSDETK